jgi:Na+/proline symporter
MGLGVFDWLVIAAYFAANLAIGVYYARRASGSLREFFLSGRDAPWWLSGTSMVATTFAADTPLAVTGFVAKNGIAGNWLWWSFLMSGMLTVFFYARLWRRAGVMTDVEFAQLRYSGKPAAFLRGFRALYLGVPINCIILGWVNKAMMTVLVTSLGVSQGAALAMLIGILAFTAFYTTLAGLWGILVTDALQFALKMTMVIVLAVFAVQAVGGIDELKSKVVAMDSTSGLSGSRLDFLPPLDSAWMPMITLMTYLCVIWWSTWYPGSEPGGGGYVAQRIFSARNERHGVLATLWFNVAHYALRPWPWILTALAALVLYPELMAGKDRESAYIRMFMDENVFPVHLRGLMIAGFAAAYMSTIATHLNWGASYVINDFYRPFVKREASERHYVIVSQATTVLLMLASIGVYFTLDSIAGAWKLLMVTGAGTGTVYLLRWYWWRINAWSEVTAMAVAAAVSIWLQRGGLGWNSDEPREFAYLMLTTVGVTTAAWLIATFATRPEPWETLEKFYALARPAGPGWRPVAKRLPERGRVVITDNLSQQFVNWLLGCTLVYAALFGLGYLLFKEWQEGIALAALAAACAFGMSRSLSSREA